MDQPCNPDGDGVALVIGCIFQFADIRYQSLRDFPLARLSAASERFLDCCRRELKESPFAALPRGLICNPKYLEQRLRFLGKAGKALLAHQYIGSGNQNHQRVVDPFQQFAMRCFPAVADVLLCDGGDLARFLVIINLGKPWAA